MHRTADDLADVFEDAAKLASRKGLTRFTKFIDPAQAIQASRIAQSYNVRFTSWGGYPDAERTVGCFVPDSSDVDISEYPLVCLHSRIHTKFSTVTHRDLLGAFMALGLTRACIGDIIIRDADVYLFAASQTAGFIADSMTSAGKTALSFSVLDEIPQMPQPVGSSYNAVVSSLRLDTVLACAYRLSRSEAADVIHAGLVKVDHLPCERVDYALKEGSLLSLRGKGRIRLVSVNGTTRKQRIGISLFRYE